MLKPRSTFRQFDVIVTEDLTGQGFAGRHGVYLGLFKYPTGEKKPDHIEPQDSAFKDYKSVIRIDDRYDLWGSIQCKWKRA
jgi:hypothetical protein